MIYFLKIIILNLSILCANSLFAMFPLQYGEHRIQGRRASMEDFSLVVAPFNKGQQNSGLFGIFDGHGSFYVARYTAKHFAKYFRESEGETADRLKNTIFKIDQRLKKSKSAYYCGTCAIVAFIEDKNLYVANLGDSRAVLCRNGEAVALSIDHTPARDIQRIKNKGDYIKNGRLNGDLTISRAIGDHEFRSISAEAEITQLEIQPEDEFLILMCDGIYDKIFDRYALIVREMIPSDKAVNIVKQSLAENSDKADRAKIAAQTLVDAAYANGSTDNLSVIIVLLNQE